MGRDGAPLRALARTLALVFAVEIASLSGPPLSVPTRYDGVVLAAHGLQDDTLMRRAAAALHPILARGLPLLAVADDPEGPEAIRARVLGASVVLATGVPARRLAGGVRQLLHRESRRVLNTDPAFQEVALALDDLMRASGRGTTPEPGLALAAVSQMRNAIAADGTTVWLERVRTVHDRTYRHSLLVSGLMAGFAQSVGFSAADTTLVLTGALLHDVGKALIPVEIIDKPGRLTEAEMSCIQQHAALGHELLLGGGYDPVVLSIVRSHHEYLDGSGYPDGLRGAEISDPVRIATLCDIFAALIEERSYKAALTPQQASEQMASMAGKLDFDLLRPFQDVFVA